MWHENGGSWSLPREKWIAVWRDGGVGRDFLFVVVFAIGAVSSLFRFTLPYLIWSIVSTILALLSWRLLLRDVERYFRLKKKFDL